MISSPESIIELGSVRLTHSSSTARMLWVRMLKRQYYEARNLIFHVLLYGAGKPVVQPGQYCLLRCSGSSRLQGVVFPSAPTSHLVGTLNVLLVHDMMLF